MNFTRTKTRGHKLNLTPMIDVIFLLIIFFMLISRFSSQEKTLIELPQAKDAETKNIASEQKKVMINIMASGEILIGETSYTESSLGAMLKSHNNDKIIIRSDKNSSWEQLRPVFNACKQAGIANPDIAVLKE